MIDEDDDIMDVLEELSEQVFNAIVEHLTNLGGRLPDDPDGT